MKLHVVGIIYIFKALTHRLTDARSHVHQICHMKQQEPSSLEQACINTQQIESLNEATSLLCLDKPVAVKLFTVRWLHLRLSEINTKHTDTHTYTELN